MSDRTEDNPINDAIKILIEHSFDAERLLGKMVERYRDKATRLAVWMEENLPDGFAIFSFPTKHRRRLNTTNMVERKNRKIRRRTRVQGSFQTRHPCYGWAVPF